jgi:hypothetical protein
MKTEMKRVVRFLLEQQAYMDDYLLGYYKDDRYLDAPVRADARKVARKFRKLVRQAKSDWTCDNAYEAIYHHFRLWKVYPGRQ